MAGQRLGVGVVGAGRWAGPRAPARGAAIARLVEEFGICETLRMARPDDVEFRDVVVPARYYSPGGLWVQEVINAVEVSHHERRWVTLPLDPEG